MDESLHKKLEEIDKKLSAFVDTPRKPSFEYLINEYNKTFDSLTENFKAIERITNNYKYVTAGLLSVVAFILTNLKDNAVFLRLFGIEPLRLLMFVLFPVLGIIMGVAAIFSLIKYRERDAWCYGRMNSIRKIMLTENGQVGAEFVEYTNSRYGSISDFLFHNGKGLRHEWYYNAKVIEAISTVWVTLLVSYFFISVWLVLIPFALFLLLNIVTNSFYRKLIHDTPSAR